MAGETHPTCELCGHPMPPGEETFKYHGYSGPCPTPPVVKSSAAVAPPRAVAAPPSGSEEPPERMNPDLVEMLVEHTRSMPLGFSTKALMLEAARSLRGMYVVRSQEPPNEPAAARVAAPEVGYVTMHTVRDKAGFIRRSVTSDVMAKDVAHEIVADLTREVDGYGGRHTWTVHPIGPALVPLDVAAPQEGE